MFFSTKYHVNTSIVNPKAIPVNLMWIIQNLTGLTNPTEKHMKVAIASMLNKQPDFSNLAAPLYNSWVFWKRLKIHKCNKILWMYVNIYIYTSYHKSGLLDSFNPQIQFNILSPMYHIQYMQISNTGQVLSQTFSFSTWNKYISHNSIVANYGKQAWVTHIQKHSSFPVIFFWSQQSIFLKKHLNAQNIFPQYTTYISLQDNCSQILNKGSHGNG